MSEVPEARQGGLDRVRQNLTPQLVGLDNVPGQGAAIIAFNHVWPAQWMVGSLDGRKLVFAEGAARGTARRLLGRARDKDPLEHSVKVLERGELLGVFPEDARSPDGRLYRGGLDLARLVLRCPVPVVPAAVVPGEGVLARAVAPQVVVGPELDLERFRDPALAAVVGEQMVLQSITDAVMHELLELSGQTYMDQASTERRRDLAQLRRDLAAERRERTRARKQAERDAAERRLARRQAEHAELQQAQELAAQAARDQAARAAAQDEVRRAVRATRGPQAGRTPARDLRQPRQHELFDQQSPGQGPGRG